MIRAALARINLAALVHNFNRVRAYAPRAKTLCVIKADAYGHGTQRVAQALSGSDGFAVAMAHEARLLREQGITAPIVVMGGFLSSEELAFLTYADVTITVHQPYHLTLLADTPLTKPINVWVKLDTGMHRLGIPYTQAQDCMRQLRKIPYVRVTGIMTHFACADEPDHPMTPLQIERFDNVANNLGLPQSMANSAGIVAWPETQREWVRPGIMLYGISPFANRTAQDLGLEPVMTLMSQIIAVNTVSAGEAIGYGASWVCPEEMRVGVIGMGYGDGYPRHARPGTPILVAGQRVPLIGRVSMDALYVDLRSSPKTLPGDPVTLWGEGLPIEEVARAAGTIGYELTCKITNRVKRFYD
jgi:alanine racemase